VAQLVLVAEQVVLDYCPLSAARLHTTVVVVEVAETSMAQTLVMQPPVA
jgi:hypothetical protein